MSRPNTQAKPTRSPCSVSSTPTVGIASQAVSAVRPAPLQLRLERPQGLARAGCLESGHGRFQGGPGARNAPGLPDYWAADALAELGAHVHLAHPLGVKAFEYRRVKNDERDAADLADLLRMGRLPEAWIAPPATRELRELVRHRAKLVALRAHCKAQVHAVLAKCGVQVPMSDLFGLEGLA